MEPQGSFQQWYSYGKIFIGCNADIAIGIRVLWIHNGKHGASWDHSIHSELLTHNYLPIADENMKDYQFHYIFAQNNFFLRNINHRYVCTAYQNNTKQHKRENSTEELPFKFWWYMMLYKKTIKCEMAFLVVYCATKWVIQTPNFREQKHHQ